MDLGSPYENEERETDETMLWLGIEAPGPTINLPHSDLILDLSEGPDHVSIDLTGNLDAQQTVQVFGFNGAEDTLSVTHEGVQVRATLEDEMLRVEGHLVAVIYA